MNRLELKVRVADRMAFHHRITRDEGRGVQVEVELESPQDQADAQALLGRLSLQVRVQ